MLHLLLTGCSNSQSGSVELHLAGWEVLLLMFNTSALSMLVHFSVWLTSMVLRYS